MDSCAPVGAQNRFARASPGRHVTRPSPVRRRFTARYSGSRRGLFSRSIKRAMRCRTGSCPCNRSSRNSPPLKSSVESRSPRPRPVDHGRGRHGSRQSHPHARNGTLRTGWEQELAAQAGRMHSCSSSPSILRTPGWRSKYCRDAAKVVSGVVAEVVSEPV